MPCVMFVVCRCAVVLEVYWCTDLWLMYCIDTPVSVCGGKYRPCRFEARGMIDRPSDGFGLTVQAIACLCLRMPARVCVCVSTGARVFCVTRGTQRKHPGKTLASPVGGRFRCDCVVLF